MDQVILRGRAFSNHFWKESLVVFGSLCPFMKERSYVLRLASMWVKEMSQAAATAVQASRWEDQTLVSLYEVRCLVSVSLPSKGTSWQRVTNSECLIENPRLAASALAVGRLQLALSVAC